MGKYSLLVQTGFLKITIRLKKFYIGLLINNIENSQINAICPKITNQKKDLLRFKVGKLILISKLIQLNICH